MIALKNIVVATDFGEASASALAYGRHLARAFSARLHLVHVVDDVRANATVGLAAAPFDVATVQADFDADARSALAALVQDNDSGTLEIRTVLLRNHDPARALLDYAREIAADLIIVGTHGRGGLAEFFLGSVAQRVVRVALCPVLTVRAEDRQFPHTDALARPDALGIARVQ